MSNMSFKGCSYGSGYSDLISPFSPEELEELLFGYPSSPSKKMGIWSWANSLNPTPSSPPTLATLSKASSPSPSSEGVPEAAMAFYAFIKGEYDPQLFVPNPLSCLLGGKEVSQTSSVTTYDGYTNPSHPYALCPRDHT
ncbi:hypothetical protein O181_089564, partial [Austropuccinia psidii MF-1]|nr:hypothetical protein [Austropuccinia psidii MF-1]